MSDIADDEILFRFILSLEEIGADGKIKESAIACQDLYESERGGCSVNRKKLYDQVIYKSQQKLWLEKDKSIHGAFSIKVHEILNIKKELGISVYEVKATPTDNNKSHASIISHLKGKSIQKKFRNQLVELCKFNKDMSFLDCRVTELQ